ncbi:MAG: hypothetical protein ACOYD0_08575 [Candidatus Nanopelagicales bacterium]
MNSTRTKQREFEATPWSGATRRYDIVKEGIVAIVIVAILTVMLAALFSSPDEPALTFKGWAQSAPEDFYATTVSELAGTSESAGYGPPYNSASEGVNVGPIRMQQWMGVHIPVDPANDFVLTPLQTQEQPLAVDAALKVWNAASADQQATWATNYDTALSDPEGADGDATKVPDGKYGPVPALATGLLGMADSGALDGVLMAQGGFYQTDYIKQILFLGDGSYLDDAATEAHLQGNTWGMMNETGSYPGQAWLWLYSVWYQIPAFNSESTDPGITTTLTENADAYIFYIMAALSVGLLLVPFIPGVRSVPRWIPVHRAIWRQYYRNANKEADS